MCAVLISTTLKFQKLLTCYQLNLYVWSPLWLTQNFFAAMDCYTADQRTISSICSPEDIGHALMPAARFPSSQVRYSRCFSSFGDKMWNMFLLVAGFLGSFIQAFSDMFTEINISNAAQTTLNPLFYRWSWSLSLSDHRFMYELMLSRNTNDKIS